MQAKECKYCHNQQLFDPTAKLHSKASGFMGAKCWQCYLAAKNPNLDPPLPPGFPEHDGISLQGKRTWNGKTLREMLDSLPSKV